MSGKIKLLNVINSKATVIPKSNGALIIVIKLIPEARIAFISLSSDNLPNVISVDNRTAIGTDNAIIQARLRKRYSNIVSISRPLPRNRSTARSKKFMNKRKVIINREKKKGSIISRIKYLDSSNMVKITIFPIDLMIQKENSFRLNLFNTANKYFNFPSFKSTYVELKLYGGCSSAG
tara:strand:+ start:37 stop:570 length:534 start_codon:yes stop_codon:yes gene_type:complete